MITEFFVWLLPIVAFFTLSWMHVFKIIYNDSDPKVSAFWSLSLATVGTALVAFLYFLLVTMVLFGYYQKQSFDLESINTTPKIVYVGSTVKGDAERTWIKSDGHLVSFPKDDVKVVQKGSKATAECVRFATHFPRLFNRGPYDKISQSASCTITIPRGTMYPEYQPPKE